MRFPKMYIFKALIESAGPGMVSSQFFKIRQDLCIFSTVWNRVVKAKLNYVTSDNLVLHKDGPGTVGPTGLEGGGNQTPPWSLEGVARSEVKLVEVEQVEAHNEVKGVSRLCPDDFMVKASQAVQRHKRFTWMCLKQYLLNS